MTDVTQGAAAPDDSALFNEAVTTDTLSKFENPVLPKAEEPPADTPKPEPKPEAKPDAPDAPVPPGRLREEADARRRAERERDDLRAQLNALRPQQPQQQPAPIDLFENPKGFVQQELRPVLDQIRADFQSQREAMSLNWALDKHGDETVSAARQALEQGMARGDQNAWGIYNRAMQSHDPYGVIVRAHKESETLRTIGGDVEAYRKRVLEEALSDPEYRKRVIEAAKGTAPNIQRAPSASVASSPSLGNIGASGGDAPMSEPSDAELFRAATTAKRR